jgi:guanylate kinase
VVLFDVDVKGALKLKEIFKDHALAIFIKAPNLDILEARLRRRGTESEDKIQVRLSKVREELMMEPKFDVVVVNDRLDKAQNEIEQVVAEFIR